MNGALLSEIVVKNFCLLLKVSHVYVVFDDGRNVGGFFLVGKFFECIPEVFFSTRGVG